MITPEEKKHIKITGKRSLSAGSLIFNPVVFCDKWKITSQPANDFFVVDHQRLTMLKFGDLGQP